MRHVHLFAIALDGGRRALAGRPARPARRPTVVLHARPTALGPNTVSMRLGSHLHRVGLSCLKTTLSNQLLP